MLQMFEALQLIGGLLAGGIIGFAFGLIQERARQRNEQRQQAGQLKSEFSVMSGSMKRVAWLMIALVLVQLVCPLFFHDGTQWWVSGGVVLGYAIVLARRLGKVQKSKT
jgi:hypothetical protein